MFALIPLRRFDGDQKRPTHADARLLTRPDTKNSMAKMLLQIVDGGAW